jgi:8-oxo-dGTP diphosphatase
MSDVANDSSQQPAVIERVAIAVVFWKAYVLVGKRPEDVPFGGLAEFPGGRVESCETWEEAARRETIEETGLCVEIGPLLASVSARYDNRVLEMRFFAAKPVSLEHPPHHPFR